MTINTYGSLCATYYALTKAHPPQEALAFYKQCAQKANGSILEPMCGTGRFLLPLLKEGYDIAGYDASPHMLAVLRTRAADWQLTPSVWEQQLETVPSKQLYNLIIIPMGSFGLLTDAKKATQALRNVYHQLKKGGRFVFEVQTANSIKKLPTWEGHVAYQNPTIFLVYSKVALASINNIFTVLCKYEWVEAGALVKTALEERKIRLYTANALMKQLQQLGFTAIQLCKAHQQGQPPDAEDEKIVFVCTK